MDASSSSASSNFIRPDDFAGLLAALSKGVGLNDTAAAAAPVTLNNSTPNNNAFLQPQQLSAPTPQPIYYGLPPSMSSNIWHQQSAQPAPLIPPGFSGANFVGAGPQQMPQHPQLSQQQTPPYFNVKSKLPSYGGENTWWKKNYGWIVAGFLIVAGGCAAIAWMRMISMKEPTIKNNTEEDMAKKTKIVQVDDDKNEEGVEEESGNEDEEDKESVPKYDPDEEFNELPPPSSVEEGVLKYLKNVQLKKEYMNWPNASKLKNSNDQNPFQKASQTSNYIDISGEDLPDLEEELRENARKSAKSIKGKVADESDEVKQYAKKRTLLFKSQNDQEESSEE